MMHMINDMCSVCVQLIYQRLNIYIKDSDCPAGSTAGQLRLSMPPAVMKG